MNFIKDSSGLKDKNIGIELLRIISMFFIVMQHFACHGIANRENLSFSINKIFLYNCQLGDLGVVIFGIISGFFLWRNKINIKKIFILEIEVLFFSILFLCIFEITGQVSFKSVIKSLFPFLSNTYWFYTAYVIVYVLFMLLNNMRGGQVNKKILFQFICFLLLIWSIVPFFAGFQMYSSDLMDLFMYFFIGALLKENFDNVIKRFNNYSILIILGCVFVLLVTNVCFNFYEKEFSFLKGKGLYFYIRKSPIIILLAISLFTTFASIKISSRVANVILYFSPASFGVYLIHENFFVRNFLWKSFIDNTKYLGSDFYILISVLQILVVFFVCLVISKLYIGTIGKIVTKIINRF